MEQRLRKHSDYQRVYRQGVRQSLPLMTYFFAPRAPREPLAGDQAANPLESRVGLTAGRVLGNAVARNRIKRRMREAVRKHRGELATGIDLVLHPRRAVLDASFTAIERDVIRAMRAASAPRVERTARS